jgi:low affinity Fe/Cu permease
MKRAKKVGFLEGLAQKTSQFAGSTIAFIVAILFVVGWLITGPHFNFSDTWQLVINTGTTIITFLMVFLIQRSQIKDSKALHLKLNELIASLKGPSNRLVDIEDFSEEEIETIHKYYQRIAQKAELEKDRTVQHSIETEKKKEKDQGVRPDQ